MKTIQLLKEQLQFDLQTLDKSVDVLLYSLNKSKKIGLKQSYSMEELEVFESLASRYARTADILTQKILKTLFIIMQEDVKTFIDRCNLCEKLEIIEDCDTLYNIRKLRNEIAHEYCIVDITEIFEPILDYSDILIQNIQTTKTYIKKIALS